MGLNFVCHSLPSQEGTFYQPPRQKPPHQTKLISSEVTRIDVCVAAASTGNPQPQSTFQVSWMTPQNPVFPVPSSAVRQRTCGMRTGQASGLSACNPFPLQGQMQPAAPALSQRQAWALEEASGDPGNVTCTGTPKRYPESAYYFRYCDT